MLIKCDQIIQSYTVFGQNMHYHTFRETGGKKKKGFLAREDVEKKKQCIMIEELIKDSLGLHFLFLNPPNFYRSICFGPVQ